MPKTLPPKKKKDIKYICLPEADLPPPEEDFRTTSSWRIFRIMSEFVEGFEFVADLKKAVAFFGSSRIDWEHKSYRDAQRLAYLLAKDGCTIVTGGGPGIMEAANKGAMAAGGESIGINIQLPEAQRTNEYITKGLGFHYFFTRKVMFAFACRVYVFFPGGFGTLDEFFEMVTLVQTKKLGYPVKVIAIGKDYWGGIMKWLEEEVCGKRGAITKEELKIITIADSPQEAYRLISASLKELNNKQEPKGG
jgi:uncharacterized protein (TIGR00730 family)